MCSTVVASHSRSSAMLELEELPDFETSSPSVKLNLEKSLYSGVYGVPSSVVYSGIV